VLLEIKISREVVETFFHSFSKNNFKTCQKHIDLLVLPQT